MDVVPVKKLFRLFLRIQSCPNESVSNFRGFDHHITQLTSLLESRVFSFHGGCFNMKSRTSHRSIGQAGDDPDFGFLKRVSSANIRWPR